MTVLFLVPNRHPYRPGTFDWLKPKKMNISARRQRRPEGYLSYCSESIRRSYHDDDRQWGLLVRRIKGESREREQEQFIVRRGVGPLYHPQWVLPSPLRTVAAISIRVHLLFGRNESCPFVT